MRAFTPHTPASYWPWKAKESLEVNYSKVELVGSSGAAGYRQGHIKDTSATL
ncbi:unnamed protein product, partial [Ceratitis capitata]